MKITLYYCLGVGLFCSGCVGPTTPFGAIRLLNGTSSFSLSSKSDRGSLNDARLRFLPERQVLHGPTNFSIVIEDPLGVPEDFRLMVLYNGRDVSEQFLNQAEFDAADPLRHVVRLTAKHLRLLPTRDNDVVVVYVRQPEARPVFAQYLPPVCSAFSLSQALTSVPNFEPPQSMLNMINKVSLQNNFNPFFVAALVAQESGFDPKALSHNRALGLTQVTTLGESEVIKRFADWPRYPGMADMSLPALRFSILSGEIHSGNEWRLDPTLSIKGGVEYLTILSDYWSRPEKKTQLQTYLARDEVSLTDVMLASYNSGATRVSEALEAMGANYLKSDDLGNAHKYVRRVVSYCDHFEHRSE